MVLSFADLESSRAEGDLRPGEERGGTLGRETEEWSKKEMVRLKPRQGWRGWRRGTDLNMLPLLPVKTAHSLASRQEMRRGCFPHIIITYASFPIYWY